MEEDGCGAEPPRSGAEPPRSGASAAHGRGARYSEAWEYFHLPRARPGLPAGQCATCRLCGRRVSRGPGCGVSTAALWKHLRSAHRPELERSGPGRPCGPRAEAPPGAEGAWGRLAEQVGALALRASRRERELEERERAVQSRERLLELRRKALEQEEEELSEERQELQAEREALRARLLLVSQRESALALAAAAAPLAALGEEAREERAQGCLLPRALF